VELPLITDEMMQARLTGTHEYVVIILRKTPRYAEIPNARAIIWEHGRRNFALRAAGLLPIVCPVTNDSDVAGIGIFNADVAQVRQLMQDDPGVQAGIFSFELHACRAFPGDSLPAERPG
jgi:hypothetical protein